MERRCYGGQGACCSVMLMGTMEPHCYQMREITAMALLFSDWSGCVNLLALIGPRRRKTKSMFRSKASFNFQSRCSQMSFLSSEAPASAVELFSAMTGECMCSLLSSLKAKCLVWPHSSCVTACAVLYQKLHRNAGLCRMSFWKLGHIHSD